MEPRPGARAPNKDRVREVSARRLKDAWAEARRRIAVRERSQARGEFYAAVIAAEEAAARFAATLSRSKREWLADGVAELLQEAYRLLLPDDIDRGAMQQQIEAGTFDDPSSPAVSSAAAFANEKPEHVVARVLVEWGYPQAAALRAVFGCAEFDEVQNSAPRKFMDRTAATRKRVAAEFERARTAELSDEEKQEWERVFAERRKRNRRNRSR